MMTRVEAEFGVVVPSYAGDATGTPNAEEYWGLYDLPLNSEVNWGSVVSFAREAESLGYNSLWSPDHFMLGKNGMTFEVWTTLSALSQVTSRVHLGTYVCCNNYRNPALVAKMASSLALMSDNRFILGYGAGWYELEVQSLWIRLSTCIRQGRYDEGGYRDNTWNDEWSKVQLQRKILRR